jgi:membrane fusion protein, multidrug efflux system
LQQAQLQQAQAQAAIARTNLQRQRDLLAQNFVSQSAVDQSAAALEVAQAQVALNRAQLDRMRILAPFDGIAGIGNVDPGDYLREGTDVVAIEDVSAMTVDFRLPERYAARVKPGQTVAVTVDALPGRAFDAKVQALDVQLDANGRSLLVRASVDNAQRELRTGMFARTRIVFATRTGAVVVPEEALVPMGDKQFVVKIIDGPQGKVSQRVQAQLGVRLAGKAEMLQGVSVEDTVVTAGHARLLARDGVPVRVVDIARVGQDGTRVGRDGAPGAPLAAEGAGGPGGVPKTGTDANGPASGSPAVQPPAKP